jgi:hypothetical protein
MGSLLFGRCQARVLCLGGSVRGVESTRRSWRSIRRRIIGVGVLSGVSALNVDATGAGVAGNRAGLVYGGRACAGDQVGA